MVWGYQGVGFRCVYFSYDWLAAYVCLLAAKTLVWSQREYLECKP